MPKQLFETVIRRMDGFSKTQDKSPWLSDWRARGKIYEFLSSRCSRDFLSIYLSSHPKILQKVARPGLMLSAVPEVDLAIRLHELGLLSDENRASFVETVKSYALEGDDLYLVESKSIQSVFTPEELEEFKTQIRSELIPELARIRSSWEDNYDSAHDADGHMQPLIDSLTALTKEYKDDVSIVERIEEEIRRAEEWINEHQSDEDEDRPNRSFGEIDTATTPVSQRSIFDDVDA